MLKVLGFVPLDEAYGVSWNGATDEVPTKNAVYDEIEAHKASTTDHSDATTSLSGFMSAADKTRLDGMDAIVAAGTDNNQTGTTYTLVLTDKDNVTVWLKNASAIAVTIPTNASVPFPVGTKINLMMEGAGVPTVTGDTGVIVNGTSGGSFVINNRYQGCTLTKRATDTWIASGDIT